MTTFYLELGLKNIQGKAILYSPGHQMNVKVPAWIFLLQDAQGRTKRSLFEIREAFPQKVDLEDQSQPLPVLPDGSPAIDHEKEAVPAIPDYQHSSSSRPI